jgi:hypothetical protein
MDINYIINRLEKIEVPSGFERDLVIIGPDIYTVQEILVSDVKIKPHPIKLIKVDIKLDGSLFVKDHRARTLIEKNHVLAIELLRRTGAKKLTISTKDDGKDDNNTSKVLLKSILSSDECYIIVSDEYRKVYLWKGKNSSVRSKFIGAKRSQDIRGQVGMHYGVVPLNEGEEDRDFLKLIGEKMTKKKRDDDDDAYLPYPYIFKPPEPPGDFAMAPQVLIYAHLKEKNPEERINCQYCGMELTKENQLTHSCKKKP